MSMRTKSTKRWLVVVFFRLWFDAQVSRVYTEKVLK